MEISYKVEGLRSLNAMEYIDLKPITVLVGLNNSGKSTFLRSLSLLKQSMESDLISPIDWRGKYVDFYDFTAALGRKNKRKEISFSFKFSSLSLYENYANKFEVLFANENSRLLSSMFPEIACNSNELRDVVYTVTLNGDENRNRISKMDVYIASLNVRFNLSFSGDGNDIADIKIDNEKLSKIIQFDKVWYIKRGLFAGEISFELNALETEGGAEFSRKISLMELTRQLNEFISEGTANDENGIIPASKAKLIDSISKNTNKNIIQNPEHQSSNISTEEKEYLLKICKIHLLWFVSSKANSVICDFISKSSYLAPARSGNYRDTQIKGVRGLDTSGSNLPNFLYFLEKRHERRFSKWVENLYGFGVETESKNGYVNLLVRFGTEKVNVDDAGFGISKLLPVLANIWWAMHKPTETKEVKVNLPFVPRLVTMEQPELHLHSRQQARIADAIAIALDESNDRDNPSPRFVIESHSEKLLSRFSKLIQEKKLSHGDIQVVMFTSKNPAKPFDSSVGVFPFNKRGKLENFPIGFFNSR